MRVGDVIKSVGGKRISDPSQLSTLIAQKQPGDHVTIVVTSGGSTRSLDVTLGTRPAGTPSTP
jgi:S1-C subfamily serine protease